MWNAAYRSFGIAAGNAMLVGKASSLPEILGALRLDSRYIGGGAGVGFKDEAVNQLDEVEPVAKEIGAVNFIVKTEDGLLKGYNTDGLGYAMSLKEKFLELGVDGGLPGKKIVILGSGGTGNAIAFMLAKEEARLVIVNRTLSKAQNLAERINNHFGLSGASAVIYLGEESIAEAVVEAQAVINVSTKGAMGDFEAYSALARAALPASEDNIRANWQEAAKNMDIIPKNAIISDVVLRNGSTPLMKMAKDRNYATLDGVPMVVYQGVEAFWLLHGKELASRGVGKEDLAFVMKAAAGF
jgi:shikimate dehydrogenase